MGSEATVGADELIYRLDVFTCICSKSETILELRYMYRKGDADYETHWKPERKRRESQNQRREEKRELVEKAKIKLDETELEQVSGGYERLVVKDIVKQI